MTYSSAIIRFDAMDHDRKARVLDIFEKLCTENVLGVHEAFNAAVEDECKAIETETMIQAKGSDTQ